MIQGTCSNAGKSLLCAALCRIFRQDGYRVAPFKSQNMALNSFITADGREMGRAQVVQAEAAGIAPDVRMNPILLKPTSDVGSQVIIMGEAQGNRTAREYWGRKKALLPIIKDAFDSSFAAENDIIVIEGAGSPAEINLKQDDIVNMGLAKLVDAPVLLVGDIDRGGVFASLYGTVKLLEEDEQARIRGLIINKFRGGRFCGDLTLPASRSSGVVPYAASTMEDSLSGVWTQKSCIGVVPYGPIFPHFRDPMSVVRGQTGAVAGADLIILPGKSRWQTCGGKHCMGWFSKAHAALSFSISPIFLRPGQYRGRRQSARESAADPVFGARPRRSRRAARCWRLTA